MCVTRFCFVLSVDYFVKLLDEWMDRWTDGLLFVSIHGVSQLNPHAQETVMYVDVICLMNNFALIP
jgi:hypothetical protein